MAATLREHPPPHVWALQKLDTYWFTTSLLNRKEQQKNLETLKVPSQPITYICKTRNQIPFLWAYPLSNLKMSFRRKKRKNPPLYSFTKKLFSKLSKKTLATTRDWSFYFKCKTLVWKGSAAEGLYKFFFYYSPFPLHMPVKTIKYLWEKCRRHGFTFQKIYFHVLHMSQSTTQESQANTLWPTSAAIADKQPLSIRALLCFSHEK